MTTVGIRALQQNASEVVGAAARGESVTITDRGRPVAQLVPLPASRLGSLIAAGRARPARRTVTSLPAPPAGPSLSTALQVMRDAERC
jgi:prevent-host-death family protein